MESTNSATLWQQIIASPGDAELKTRFRAALARERDPRAEMFDAAEEHRRIAYGYPDRAAELLRQYEALLGPWHAEFEPWERKWKAEVHFILGWPIEITIAARDFLRHAAEIVTVLPLRHLNLTEVNDAIEIFEATPELDRIVSLYAGNQPLSDTAIAAIAASPWVHTLRWLNLAKTGITDAHVEMLAASPQLEDVAYIGLEDNPCRDPADMAAGYGTDWMTNTIVPESIYLPEFGHELEDRYGRREWLHVLWNFMQGYAPDRYHF